MDTVPHPTAEETGSEMQGDSPVVTPLSGWVQDCLTPTPKTWASETGREGE